MPDGIGRVVTGGNRTAEQALVVTDLLIDAQVVRQGVVGEIRAAEGGVAAGIAARILTVAQAQTAAAARIAQGNAHAQRYAANVITDAAVLRQAQVVGRAPDTEAVAQLHRGIALGQVPVIGFGQVGVHAAIGAELLRYVGGKAAFHMAAQVRGIHRTFGQRLVHIGFEGVVGARIDRLVKAVITAGGVAVANQAEAGVGQIDGLGITKTKRLPRQGLGVRAHVVADGMGHVQRNGAETRKVVGKACQHGVVLFTDDGATEQGGTVSQPPAVGALYKARLLWVQCTVCRAILAGGHGVALLTFAQHVGHGRERLDIHLSLAIGAFNRDFDITVARGRVQILERKRAGRHPLFADHIAALAQRHQRAAIGHATNYRREVARVIRQHVQVRSNAHTAVGNRVKQIAVG